MQGSDLSSGYRESHERSEPCRSHVIPAPPEEHTTPTPLDNPQDEGVEVSDQLARSRDASFNRQHRGRLPLSRLSSSSSTFSALDGRMSINPAYEVAESLRSSASDGMSSARSASETASISSTMEENDAASRQVNGNGPKMGGMLSADDGMRSLRQQLHQIRNLAISTEEKARKMHILMTNDYVAHRAASPSPSPLSLDDGHSKSPSGEPAALDVGLAALPIDASNPYNIRPGDLVPTFRPLTPSSQEQQDLSESVEEEPRPMRGCVHYLRNVKVQCFDCHRWFPCRHCHDQSNDLPFPHSLRRKLTRNMLCMLCQTPQPAAEICVNCEEWAAYYYCPKCKLWDNDSNKSIYHCDDCGICRLGEGLGKDFVHCKKCNVCISISTSAAHPCIEGATEGDCPLCLEEMFASRGIVVSLPCGHYMHADCYKDLMKVTYKCPVCSKSAVNMELQWRKLDDEIQLQPMPDEDEEELNGILPPVEGHVDQSEATEATLPRQRRPKSVWIGCNDCGSRCWTAFHWLGLKCRICDSYNTNQMAPTAGYETEAARLIRQQQIHRQHDFTGVEVLLDAGIGAEEAFRVDSALGVPSSPSQVAFPASPGSPSSGTSSPRRYFVQSEEPRRPSFTVPRFSAPTLPTLPNLREIPRLPRLPTMPQLPHMPHMPQLPHMPNLPNIPNLPHMPNLELPRFSPYDVFDSLSRSLSPMRYYLQGQDIQFEQQRGRDVNRNRSSASISIRSDPTGTATEAKRTTKMQLDVGDDDDEDDAINGWTTDEEDDDDSDDGVLAIDDDEEDSEEEDDEDESEDDEDVGSDAGAVGDGLDMEIPGHR